MIRCIAIDDEFHALRQISDYIEKTPFLSLMGKFESALQALPFIRENIIDLMFVDINMPDLSGMDFVKSLNNPPKIIFTTAYSEYAIDGFKVDAVDYLLKPISYKDFLKAANKANERFFSKNSTPAVVQHDAEFLFIKSEYKVIRINYDNIKYIEGKSEYVQIFIENHEPIMSLMSLKKLVEHLPENQFMRVHRSFIVNLDKITIIERNRIVFDQKVYIPISDQYQKEFQKYLDEKFLK